MAKLKIYDGAKWVTPDADTVDGKHASDFATASHTHNYLPLSGGNLTGNINTTAQIYFNNAKYLYGKNGAGTNFKLIGCSSSDNLVIGDEANKHPSVNIYGNNLKFNGSHIIEQEGPVTSGQNTHWWVRFSDGTQIVYTIYGVWQNVNTSWGTGYSATLRTDGLYPVKFSRAPVVSAVNVGSKTHLMIMSCRDASATNLPYTDVWSSSSYTNAEIYVNIISIGRWK